jgi:hypothetical protein
VSVPAAVTVGVGHRDDGPPLAERTLDELRLVAEGSRELQRLAVDHLPLIEGQGTPRNIRRDIVQARQQWPGVAVGARVLPKDGPDALNLAFDLLRLDRCRLQHVRLTGQRLDKQPVRPSRFVHGPRSIRAFG